MSLGWSHDLRYSLEVEHLSKHLNLDKLYKILDLSKTDKITILDVGCGGGPDGLFLSKNNFQFLTWLGIDINETEINRLIEGYRDLDNFNFLTGRISTKYLTQGNRNPWNEKSASEMAKIIKQRDLSHREKIDNNFITEDMGFNFSIKDYSPKKILDLQKSEIVKIDYDSGETLGFLTEYLEESSQCRQMPQAVVVEVDFYGDETQGCNTFHNVDRLMKKHKYTLGGLSVRTYSNKIMPGVFQYKIAAQTLNGTPYQGDAMYFLDYNDDESLEKVENIKKFAIVLSLFGLHDEAASLIFKCNLEEKVKLRFLDYLAKYVNVPDSPNYKTLMQEFSKQASKFWPQDVIVGQKNTFKQYFVKLISGQN